MAPREDEHHQGVIVSTDDELEVYWRDLRLSTVEVSSQKTPLEQMLDAAALATFESLRTTYKSKGFTGGNLNEPEFLAKVVVTAVRQFMSNWYEAQKKQDLGVLVEIILEGQDVSVEDLKGFVRALPRSIVNRILGELRGQATGLHALLSIEALHRDGSLRDDYTLRIDMNKKLVVSFHPKQEEGSLSFTLQELFAGPDP